jgi:hypothetical protein
MIARLLVAAVAWTLAAPVLLLVALAMAAVCLWAYPSRGRF